MPHGNAAGVWIIAEQVHGYLRTISAELLARARALADKLGSPLTAVLLGEGVADAAEALVHHGADQVFVVDHPALRVFDPDPYTTCLERLVKEESPSVVVAGATSSGRTLMPLLAARLHTGLTADCTDLDIEKETGLLLQTRPAIGGNVMATIKTPAHKPQMATVRPRSHPPSPLDPARTGRVTTRTFDEVAYRSRYVIHGAHPSPTEGNIEDAKVVVGVGRGLGRGDGLAWIRQLARVWDGEVGATRAVVDQGWLPYPCQVGLSGKTISPELYFACGISGAIQHLAGMRSAEMVIAINKDPRAPIFQAADLAVVGDLAEILPRLVRKLQETKSPSLGAQT